MHVSKTCINMSLILIWNPRATREMRGMERCQLYFYNLEGAQSTTVNWSFSRSTEDKKEIVCSKVYASIKHHEKNKNDQLKRVWTVVQFGHFVSFKWDQLYLLNTIGNGSFIDDMPEGLRIKESIKSQCLLSVRRRITDLRATREEMVTKGPFEYNCGKKPVTS